MTPPAQLPPYEDTLPGLQRSPQVALIDFVLDLSDAGLDVNAILTKQHTDDPDHNARHEYLWHLMTTMDGLCYPWDIVPENSSTMTDPDAMFIGGSMQHFDVTPYDQQTDPNAAMTGHGGAISNGQLWIYEDNTTPFVPIHGKELAETVAKELLKPNRQIFSLPQDHDFPLALESFEDAGAVLFTRKAYHVDQDDTAAVKTNFEANVKSLMRAIVSVTFIGAEEEKSKTNSGKTLKDDAVSDWRRWQEGHVKRVREALSLPNIEIEVEARAWELLRNIIAVHEYGYRTLMMKIDLDLRCSERLAAVIEAIQDYAVIRADTLAGTANLEDLAAAPLTYSNQKKSNQASNLTRSKHSKGKATAGSSTPAQGLNAGAVTEDADEEDEVPMDAEEVNFNKVAWTQRYSDEDTAAIQKLMIKRPWDNGTSDDGEAAEDDEDGGDAKDDGPLDDSMAGVQDRSTRA